MKNFKTTLFGGLVALTLNTTANAMDSNDSAVEIPVANATSDTKEKCCGKDYDFAYFEAFAPRTALDMVSRIPGFQIDSGNTGKRGLGNGGANVLLNGYRISGKTNARDQLSRINAKNVVNIKIVDGTSLDIPGLSGQVANVTTKTTGISGTWEWRGELRSRIKPNLLGGKATVSGETGKLAWSFTAESNPFRNGNRGLETQTDANGVLFETRYEDGQFYGDQPGVSADFTWKPKEEHTANLNLKYNQFNFNGREVSRRTAITAAGTTQETLFSNAEDEENGSIDIDYELPFLKKDQNGKLKLIGYYRFEHSPTVSRFDVFDPVLGQIDGSRFFRVADESELIGRTEYSWKPSNGRDWQIGIEGVFNVLDIESSLLLLDAGGNFVDEPLYGATSRVEEKRAEATLTHGRKLSDKWNLQVSAGAEYSQISQNTGLTRSFFRPKGFVSATYKPTDKLTITTRIERDVGQLSFFDFISSVSLQDNLDRTGNANLVPQQSWNGEIEFDKSFGDGNTFKAEFYGRLISDRVDRIPIFDDIDPTLIVGDAVGNVDSAHQYGMNLSATIKGDKWGYKGTQIDLTLNARNSSIEDPIQGFKRRISNDFKSYWAVEFRHDIPNSDWAWGVFADQFRRAQSFRISTINQFTFAGPWGQTFIEHKDIFGMKARFTLGNLFDASDDFRREVYDNGRVNLIRVEDRTREFDLTYRLQLSGTF